MTTTDEQLACAVRAGCEWRGCPCAGGQCLWPECTCTETPRAITAALARHDASTGPEVSGEIDWDAAQRVFDAAYHTAYHGSGDATEAEIMGLKAAAPHMRQGAPTLNVEILEAADAAISALADASFKMVGRGRECPMFDLPAERLKDAVAQARSSAPPQQPGGYQKRVQAWMQSCFSREICADRTERNHRFLEEALELVQSGGCTVSEAHQLVDYVFGRDVGKMRQEVGGVMVTLAAFCSAHEIDMDACADAELARCWTKIEKIRAKQAAKPKHAPLPEHAPSQPSQDARVTQLVAAAQTMLDEIGDWSDFDRFRRINEALAAFRTPPAADAEALTVATLADLEPPCWLARDIAHADAQVAADPFGPGWLAEEGQRAQEAFKRRNGASSDALVSTLRAAAAQHHGTTLGVALAGLADWHERNRA